jgi:elongation factor 1-gamma
MKVLTQRGNSEGNKIAVTAGLVGVSVEFGHDFHHHVKELSKHTLGQQAPIFEAPFGHFVHATPVLKYLANGHELYPAAAEVRFQVDEALETVKEDLEKPLKLWLDMVFGHVPKDAEKLKKAQADVKKFLFILEQQLKKHSHLVGQSLTIADVSLASDLFWAFRALFDEKYRKPLPALSNWFTTIANLPQFKAVWGPLKLAKVALEPANVAVVKHEEEKKHAPKKEEEKKAPAKPKPKDDDEEDEAAEKKQANPLDLLPPTTFELDEWKKLITNTKDRRSVMPNFWEKLDRAGWSCWFIHYEKYAGEGEQMVPFENLLDGFVQRMESIRRYSFGVMAIYGEVPALEIKGCLLMRGQEVLQGLIDHPQFEYCKRAKADWHNDEDRKRIEDFWCNVHENDKVDNLVVQVVRFWK